MTMLSDHVIKAMGYEENNPPIRIECKFYCLKVYCIEGVHFDLAETDHRNRLSEFSIFGIGNNINDICMKMTNDTFSEDLEKWEKEKNARAPYLITLTSNNSDYVENCKWSQQREGQILTYNCFSKAKSDLDEFITRYEIPYIPAITAMLTSADNLVKLTHVDTTKYGLTIEGETLLDIKVSGSARLSTSTKKSLEKSFLEIVERLETYISPGERFSRLIYSSMQETDDIKSFLFAWTALEVFINQHFNALSIKDFPERDIPEAYSDRIKKLFSDAKRGRVITSLAQKFAYLSIFLWNFLNTDDYDTFMSAKSIRDKFTHGDKINQTALPTREILLLVNKIIHNIAG